MDVKYRIPLILNLYHNFTADQIARITDSSILEVDGTIQAAIKLLSDDTYGQSTDLIRKKLEFLGKSYNRLPVLFEAGRVTSQDSQVKNTIVVKERTKRNRVTLLTASILGILILVLVAGTYFSGEEWDMRSDRKYIEKLNKDFAAVAKEKQLILGLNDKLFNSIPTQKIKRRTFSKPNPKS